MRPMQSEWLLASAQAWEISADVLTTGLQIILTGIVPFSCRLRAMIAAWAPTFFRVSSPYKCWLPVRNHTSSFLRSDMSSCLLITDHNKHPVRVFFQNVF